MGSDPGSCPSSSFVRRFVSPTFFLSPLSSAPPGPLTWVNNRNQGTNGSFLCVPTSLTCDASVSTVFWNLFVVYHLQVLINHAENKDGSGRPLDYEDLESGEVLFPRDTTESARRTRPQPAEHQSVVPVSSFEGSISISIEVTQLEETPQLKTSHRLCLVSV